MANPANSAGLLADRNGKPIITTQSSNVADAAAPTAYSAHSSGSTPVTSNAATDLDTTAAALETLRDEVAALTTAFNSVKDILEAHGLMADA
jgi:hypothetical protein